MHTCRLRVTLRDVVPPVLRVVDVPVRAPLPELHLLLQAALGWTDSHLHEFEAGGRTYGPPDLDELVHILDETGATLADLTGPDLTGPDLTGRDLPGTFVYRYDFGDGWEHDVEVMGSGGDRPGCPYGEGTCPPENCGGPGGYLSLREVLLDPEHPEHAWMLQWAGELRDFDQAATDRLVLDTAGAVPASVRLVLDLARDGVTLTPGGRLPRSFVRRVQEDRPGWAWSERPASREEDLVPLLALHEVLRDAGLLRLTKGVLCPTRAAADDRQVVQRLRGWFAADPFTDALAALTVAVVASSGPHPLEELGARVEELLGDEWMLNGGPVPTEDVRVQIARLSSVLRGLDVIVGEHLTFGPGPAARTLLPRATALAHGWDNASG